LNLKEKLLRIIPLPFIAMAIAILIFNTLGFYSYP